MVTICQFLVDEYLPGVSDLFPFWNPFPSLDLLVIAKHKILILVFFVAVFSGYAPSRSCASLLSVSNQDFSSGSNDERTPDSPSPQRPDVLKQRVMLDCSCAGTNAPSVSNGVSILVVNSCFDVVLSHAAKVYFLGRAWLPKPPVYELLKVPIVC